MSPEKVIISARTDGFGARIIALLNAMFVARQMGLPFKFYWSTQNNDFHALPTVTDLFAPEFLARNSIQPVSLDPYPKVAAALLDRAYLETLLADQRALGVNIYHNISPVAWQGREPDWTAFAPLWNEIQFSEPLQRVIELARRADLSHAVAVHLRRGDIVFGKERFGLFNSKFMPRASLKWLIEAQSAMGESVVLFSDDLDILKEMRGQPNVIVTDSLDGAPAAGSFERALFDIEVMARCRQIIAGVGSNFAALAGMIGAHEPVSHRSLLDGVALKQAVLDDLRHAPQDYKPLERAKELSWVALELKDVVSPTEQFDLLAQASAIDPRNQSYTLLQALNLADRGQRDMADKMVGTLMEGVFAASSRCRTEFHTGGLRRSTEIEDMRRTVGEGYPYLTTLYLARLPQSGAGQTRRELAQKAYECAPASDLLLSLYARELIRVGEDSLAAVPLEQALQSGRDAPLLNMLMSEIAERRSDTAGAVRHMRAAAALAPGNQELQFRVIPLLVRNGETDEARAMLAQFTPETVKDVNAAYHAADAYKLLGDSAAALAWALAAQARAPTKKRLRKLVVRLEKASKPKPPLTSVQRVRKKLKRIFRPLTSIWFRKS